MTDESIKNGIYHLTCCVCGNEAIGRQWHNRDTGYGICPKCAEYVKTKQTPEENQSYYGIEGIHYNIEVIK